MDAPESPLRRRTGRNVAVGAAILAVAAGWFAWARPPVYPTDRPVAQVTTPASSSPSTSPANPTPLILPTSFRLGSKLPWPLVAITTGGRFFIRTDGKVVALPPSVRPKRSHFVYPSGWVSVADDAAAGLSHGRIIIRRSNSVIGYSVIWRSHLHYPESTAADLSGILLGASGVALATKGWGPLYVAAGRGPERLVAPNEFPAMWTRSGNLLTVAKDPLRRRFSYLLRSPGGELLETLASGLGIPAIDASSSGVVAGTFLFWDSRGDLWWTDGAVTRTLANYHALGLASQPSITAVSGGLVELITNDWHEVIIRSDGGIFARASAPIDGSVAGFGGQVASLDGTQVVYVLYGPRHATVYLLKQGSTQGVPIYRTVTTVSLDYIPLFWHGRWVLFTPPGAKSVIIDTAGRRSPIVLPAPLSRDFVTLKLLRWASAGEASREAN